MTEVIYDCGTVTKAEKMRATLKRRGVKATQKGGHVHVFPTQGLQRAAMSAVATQYEAVRLSGG